MAPKKASSKGKDGTYVSEVQGWRTSKCSDSHLLGLVEEKILQPHEVVHWRKASWEDCPREEGLETVVFNDFILRGFGVPTSDFFRGLLFYWGIQVHHLNPNSILHLSIFVHLCEAFLGIEPHFDLFQYFFHLKPQPSSKEIDVAGRASLQLR